MFDVLEAFGMTEDILIETHGNNIVVGMPGTSYRVRYRRPNGGGRQLVALNTIPADSELLGHSRLASNVGIQSSWEMMLL